MYICGRRLYSSDGLVLKGVENTIDNFDRLDRAQ